MTFERPLIYALAALIILVGLLKRSNSLRARIIKGPVVVGDISGTSTQNYTEAGPSARGKVEGASPAPPDRIAWAILIIGVLVAAGQLAHDVFWGK